MNRIDSFLRFLAVWPGGRLRLTMFVDSGFVEASAVNVDGVRVLGPVRRSTVDEAVVDLMTAAMEKAGGGA